MFDLLNLLFTGGLAVGKALGITLFLLSDVPFPQQLGQVARVEMSSAAVVAIRVRPKTEEELCRYSGVLVPYERLWEEPSPNGGDTVLPPEPGKIAAYALVINRKDCAERQPEAMFRVATVTLAPYDHSTYIGKGAHYVVMPLQNLAPDMRPKWVPQVLEALAAAKENPVAQEFLRFNAEHKLATDTLPAEQKVEPPVEQKAEVPADDAPSL